MTRRVDPPRAALDIRQIRTAKTSQASQCRGACAYRPSGTFVFDRKASRSVWAHIEVGSPRTDEIRDDTARFGTTRQSTW